MSAQSEELSLSDRMYGLKSLAGRFIQAQFDESGSVLGEQEGRFQIVTPGKIRWETIEPMPQLLISDGGRYWLYDPDLEQVTTGAIDGTLQMAPAILFSGAPERLYEEYDIQQLSDGHFQLLPKQENPLFKKLELTFLENNLVGLSMLDHMEQRTAFELLETEQNLVIQSDLFTFEIPQGTDVVYQ
ncbi:outer membrane lipoprotein chaperone LolA [Candidatus Pelagadaptatus aseana]|uniref:outer membrane lipoprotein chaperone LolA n=1 Tax=Candidatus Pelagadaptatus aseana TaxID=3120508 RepID=UPI003C704E80